MEDQNQYCGSRDGDKEQTAAQVVATTCSNLPVPIPLLSFSLGLHFVDFWYFQLLAFTACLMLASDTSRQTVNTESKSFTSSFASHFLGHPHHFTTPAPTSSITQTEKERKKEGDTHRETGRERERPLLQFVSTGQLTTATLWTSVVCFSFLFSLPRSFSFSCCASARAGLTRAQNARQEKPAGTGQWPERFDGWLLLLLFRLS